MSKSTIHGIIQALLKIEALEISPKNKKFHLGPAIVDLAFKSWDYLHVSEKAQPLIDELRDSIDETVFVCVIGRSRAIIMAAAETSKPIKLSSPAGTAIPILSGAIGKVFLSQFDDIKAAKYIRENTLPKFTQKSIVNEEIYLSELKKVREQGYALDNEEYITGVRAVAVALGNRKGLPVVICVVGFLSSMPDEKMDNIISLTSKVSNVLKSKLDTRV